MREMLAILLRREGYDVVARRERPRARSSCLNQQPFDL